MGLAFSAERLSAISSMSLPELELFRFSVHPQQTVSTAKTYKGALQTVTEALVFPTPYGNFAGNKGS